MSSDLFSGAAVGLIGGVASGLTGTSPGGALVVLVSAFLGVDQHVAQGASLIAQVPPTSLAGIVRYRAGGARSPVRWIAWLTGGFLVGGLLGAFAAGAVPDRALRWTYVGYLALLGVLILARGARPSPERTGLGADAAPAWLLLTIGLAAGLSAGFLGIGGGLATTVGLTVLLRASQHQAQMISLMLSLAPVNLPAAWIYYQAGWTVSWPALAGIVAGLVLGGDLGARLANRMSAGALRALLLVMILGMTGYMAWRALA